MGKRKTAVLIIVLLQVAVLAFMAAEREYIYRYGKIIFLRTAPVDPRDLFRGDYVRLDYDISSVPKDKLKKIPTEERMDRGVKVYAALKPSAGDLYELDYLADSAPENVVFISGRTLYPIYSRSEITGLEVKYGIEKYFVEQGKGREIEEKRGQGADLQIPMEVEVALASDGTAVLRGYRWSKLGIKLEILRPAPGERNVSHAEPAGEPAETEPHSPKVKVSLTNVSEGRLALANPGDNCGFRLIQAQSGGWEEEFPAADQSCGQIAVEQSDLIYLAPQESLEVEIDLSLPRWHVLQDGKPVEIGALGGWQRFRLVYQPPEGTADLPVQHAEIWLNDLPTRAFNASGRVD